MGWVLLGYFYGAAVDVICILVDYMCDLKEGFPESLEIFSHIMFVIMSVIMYVCAWEFFNCVSETYSGKCCGGG